MICVPSSNLSNVTDTSKPSSEHSPKSTFSSMLGEREPVNAGSEGLQGGPSQCKTRFQIGDMEEDGEADTKESIQGHKEKEEGTGMNGSDSGFQFEGQPERSRDELRIQIFSDKSQDSAHANHSPSSPSRFPFSPHSPAGSLHSPASHQRHPSFNATSQLYPNSLSTAIATAAALSNNVVGPNRLLSPSRRVRSLHQMSANRSGGASPTATNRTALKRSSEFAGYNIAHEIIQPPPCKSLPVSPYLRRHPHHCCSFSVSDSNLPNSLIQTTGHRHPTGSLLAVSGYDVGDYGPMGKHHTSPYYPQGGSCSGMLGVISPRHSSPSHHGITGVYDPNRLSPQCTSPTPLWNPNHQQQALSTDAAAAESSRLASILENLPQAEIYQKRIARVMSREALAGGSSATLSNSTTDLPASGSVTSSFGESSSHSGSGSAPPSATNAPITPATPGSVSTPSHPSNFKKKLLDRYQWSQRASSSSSGGSGDAVPGHTTTDDSNSQPPPTPIQETTPRTLAPSAFRPTAPGIVCRPHNHQLHHPALSIHHSIDSIDSVIRRNCRIESSSSSISYMSNLDWESDPFSPASPLSPFPLRQPLFYPTAQPSIPSYLLHPQSAHQPHTPTPQSAHQAHTPTQIKSTSPLHRPIQRKVSSASPTSSSGTLTGPQSANIPRPSNPDSGPIIVQQAASPVPIPVSATTAFLLRQCQSAPQTPESSPPRHPVTSQQQQYFRYHQGAYSNHLSPSMGRFVFPPPPNGVVTNQYTPSNQSPLTPGHHQHQSRHLLRATHNHQRKVQRHHNYAFLYSPADYNIDKVPSDGSIPFILAPPATSISSDNIRHHSAESGHTPPAHHSPLTNSPSEGNLSPHDASSTPSLSGDVTSPNSKAHLCRVCGRKFTRSDMLARHARLHTGHKPYACRLCGQAFSRSDHLNTHMRTHTGEKPYQCPSCSYSACRRDMITRHMRVHKRPGADACLPSPTPLLSPLRHPRSHNVSPGSSSTPADSTPPHSAPGFDPSTSVSLDFPLFTMTPRTSHNLHALSLQPSDPGGFSATHQQKEETISRPKEPPDTLGPEHLHQQEPPDTLGPEHLHQQEPSGDQQQNSSDSQDHIEGMDADDPKSRSSSWVEMHRGSGSPMVMSAEHEDEGSQ